MFNKYSFEWETFYFSAELFWKISFFEKVSILFTISDKESSFNGFGTFLDFCLDVEQSSTNYIVNHCPSDQITWSSLEPKNTN